MKNKIFLFIVSLWMFGSIYGQEIDSTSFNKAIDLLNYKSILLSLKSGASPGALDEFENKCACSANPNFTKIITSIPSSAKATSDLSKEIETIKVNEYNTSLDGAKVINLLTEQIFVNQTKYPKLFSFAKKRITTKDFLDFKSRLKTELTSNFGVEAKSANSPIEQYPKKEKSQIANNDEAENLVQNADQNIEDKNWFDGFTFQIDVISIFLTLVVLLILVKHIYFSRGDGNDRISETIRNYVNKKISDADVERRSHLGSRSNYNGSDLKKIKDDIEELKLKLRKLSIADESSKFPLEVIPPKNDQSSLSDATQLEAKAYSEVLYLSAPNDDGSFDETYALSSYREGASIYKFTKTSPTRAKFKIDEREASIKLALQYPDKTIDPACDAQNAFNSKAKKIVTLPGDEGEVYLVGDRWMLNRKAKIRYEN